MMSTSLPLPATPEQAMPQDAVLRPWQRIVLAMVIMFGLLSTTGTSPSTASRSSAMPVSLASRLSADQRSLIDQTTGQAVKIVSKGVQAKAGNNLIPLGRLPIKSARPFILPAGTSSARTAELCMTQAIYYEAGFEPTSGKRAVAQVVLNRMRHPAFPGSVCGVVYQGSNQRVCQFSFTCDGSLGRTPATGAWAAARTVAKAALAGHVERGVGTATHYHADYVLPYWAYKLPKISNIGTHIFYRWPGSWGEPGAFTRAYSGHEFIPSVIPRTEREALVMVNDDPATLAAVPVRHVTERRADNDIGGRIDTTKSWRLSFPDPTPSVSAGAQPKAAEHKPNPSPAADPQGANP